MDQGHHQPSRAGRHTLFPANRKEQTHDNNQVEAKYSHLLGTNHANVAILKSTVDWTDQVKLCARHLLVFREKPLLHLQEVVEAEVVSAVQSMPLEMTDATTTVDPLCLLCKICAVLSVSHTALLEQLVRNQWTTEHTLAVRAPPCRHLFNTTGLDMKDLIVSP